MKLRPILALLSLVLVASPILRAQDAMAPAAGAPSDEKKTPIEERMSKVSKALRTLKKQASDASKNDSSLALVATMQAGINDSMDLIPSKAAGLPDDQKAKFIESYKAGLKAMLDQLNELAADFKAGKNDDAVALIASIEAAEKKDHKEFRKPKNG